MDNVTHFAALRAAARVAFGVAILGGCAAETSTETASADTESDIKKTEASTCHHDAGQPAPKKSCDQVLASAFPDAGAFTWHPFGEDAGAPQVADDVTSCCAEDLSKNRGMSQYRWACCDVLDNGAGTNDRDIGLACTPWGPPVPPRMRKNLALEGVA